MMRRWQGARPIVLSDWGGHSMPYLQQGGTSNIRLVKGEDVDGGEDLAKHA